MRHITSSRLKQSNFLLDRLHKLKAWSRRKFPVEEQGKPICVPNELCNNISTPSHAFCPWHLLCLACSSAPTYSASRHFNASCSASCRASRNLMPFPSFQETTARFLSKEVCKKSDGHPYQAGECQFFAQTWTRRSHCSAVSCSRPSAEEAG